MSAVRRTCHLSVIEEVVPCYMGLWYAMMRLAQGHAAHVVLATGVVLVEYLRHYPDKEGKVSEDEYQDMHRAAGEFGRAAANCCLLLTSEKDRKQYRFRVDNIIRSIGVACQRQKGGGNAAS